MEEIHIKTKNFFDSLSKEDYDKLFELWFNTELKLFNPTTYSLMQLMPRNNKYSKKMSDHVEHGRGLGYWLKIDGKLVSCYENWVINYKIKNKEELIELRDRLIENSKEDFFPHEMARTLKSVQNIIKIKNY
jgi:hypothetical protein